MQNSESILQASCLNPCQVDSGLIDWGLAIQLDTQLQLQATNEFGTSRLNMS